MLPGGRAEAAERKRGCRQAGEPFRMGAKAGRWLVEPADSRVTIKQSVPYLSAILDWPRSFFLRSSPHGPQRRRPGPHTSLGPTAQVSAKKTCKG
jgi:hypothetical protein